MLTADRSSVRWWGWLLSVQVAYCGTQSSEVTVLLKR